MAKPSLDRAESLIEALPFIQKFRGQTFVIKYGGSAMEDEQVIERFLRDVVFLEAVGINPVLVHGGGKAITQRMRDAGLKPRFVNGLRVTDARSIEIVEEVLARRKLLLLRTVGSALCRGAFPLGRRLSPPARRAVMRSVRPRRPSCGTMPT